MEIAKLKKVNKPSAVTLACGSDNYGNIWVFPIDLKNKGDKAKRHKHEFDHLHLIARGKAEFLVFDDTHKLIHKEIFVAPAWLRIPRNTDHQIIALEDNTLGYCIHPIRNQEGDLIDSNYGEEIFGSYAFEPSSNIREIK